MMTAEMPRHSLHNMRYPLPGQQRQTSTPPITNIGFPASQTQYPVQQSQMVTAPMNSVGQFQGGNQFHAANQHQITTAPASNMGPGYHHQQQGRGVEAFPTPVSNAGAVYSSMPNQPPKMIPGVAVAPEWMLSHNSGNFKAQNSYPVYNSGQSEADRDYYPGQYGGYRGPDAGTAVSHNYAGVQNGGQNYQSSMASNVHQQFGQANRGPLPNYGQPYSNNLGSLTTDNLTVPKRSNVGPIYSLHPSRTHHVPFSTYNPGPKPGDVHRYGRVHGEGRLYDPNGPATQPSVSVAQPPMIGHGQALTDSRQNVGWNGRDGESDAIHTSILAGHREFEAVQPRPQQHHALAPIQEFSFQGQLPLPQSSIPRQEPTFSMNIVPFSNFSVYAKRPYDLGPMEDFSSVPSIPTEEVFERLLSYPVPENAIGRGFTPMDRIANPNGAKALALEIKGKGKEGGCRVPAEVNCCIYIEGLHPQTTYRDLFQSVRGKILRTHITPPQHKYPTAAAKIGFCTRRDAVNTYNHIVNGNMYIRGHVVRMVRWNWDGHREEEVYFKHQTRVLIIEGPTELMSFELFEKLWSTKIHYDLEARFRVPCNNQGRTRYEYRFGSIANQAEAAKWIIEREPILAGKLYEVTYGQDPCDD